MRPIIRVTPAGQMGNRMFQYMAAMSILHSVPNAVVEGYDLKEWGIIGPRHSLADDLYKVGYFIPKNNVVRGMLDGAISGVHLQSVPARVDCFEEFRGFFQQIFRHDNASVPAYGSQYLVIHIRLGDITIPNHAPQYTIMPISFYQDLVKRTSLRPVFVGQLGNDGYSQALERAFPDAVFHKDGTVLHDFGILRNATNVAISCSSFSWMATWLSSSVEKIYLPVSGWFNPQLWPMFDLLPVGDSRYEFHLFPARKAQGLPGDLEYLTESKNPATLQTRREMKIFRDQFTWRRDPYLAPVPVKTI